MTPVPPVETDGLMTIKTSRKRRRAAFLGTFRIQ
jgi:hypothetical protein